MNAPLERALRVLVVDDSAVARQVLASVLSAAGMEVRSAADPLFARQKLQRFEPDVLVLDLEMPRMDGITFLRELRAEGDLPVVVCSGVTGDRGEKALLALEEGAVEVVTKPQTALRDFLFESSVMLVDAVIAAAETRPSVRARRRRNAMPSMSPAPAPARGRRELIAIGASTGGPEAIRRILGAFPPTAPATVIVQHMPAGFTRAFAQHLDESSRVEVREAVHGDVLRAGVALLAPGGRHLRVVRAGPRLQVEVAGGPLISRHRPSVDCLFDSVAEAAGGRAVAALLTGMGEDGAAGLENLKSRGAFTIAQDEESSVVYGMPKAALDRGAVAEVASLDQMASALLRHC